MPFLAQERYPVPTKDIPTWLFDDVNYDKDEEIYIDALKPSRSITARQARVLVRQLAAGFKALGLKPGDCISIHSFNDICYPIFFLGVIAAGCVFAGTNPGYTPYELAHAFKIAKVKCVLVQPDLLASVRTAALETSIPKERIVIFNPDGKAAPEGFLVWNDLLKHGEQDWVRFDDLETTKNSEAARLFSSGTTGLPKAATLSHYNFIAQQTLVYEANPRPWKPRRVLALPLFHAAAAPGAFCGPLREGSRAYIMPRLDLEKWFWCHEHFQVTDCALVPPLALMAVNSPFGKKYSLKSLRVVTSGAAPLDSKLQARVQEMVGPQAPFTQVWGMTETSCIATRFPYPQKDITGSVGVPLPSIDVKLVDDDGKDITGYDVRGELCVRGPSVIRGYFDNPEANARDFDCDEYFHTGDIAFIDGKSKLYYIVDRKKELIKVRAFQVAPPELEGVLLDHPQIVDCGVIGVPDPARIGNSELPRAYVVRRPGSGDNLKERDVHTYMRSKLASYKMLEGGIVFVDAIPKNASGKILKRILREQAKKEMGAKL